MKNIGFKIVIVIFILDIIVGISRFFGYEFLYSLSKLLIPNFSRSQSSTSNCQSLLCLMIAAVESFIAIFYSEKTYAKLFAILTPLFSLGGFFILSYFYQGYCYSFDGNPIYYVVLPDCEVRFSVKPGVDSQYGLPLKKADINAVMAYNWLKGQKADKLGRTFQFCEESANEVKIYDNPFSSNPCDIRPVCSREQLERHQQQQERAQKHEQKKQQIESINSLLKQALSEVEKCKLAEGCGYDKAIELINQARLIDPAFNDIKVVERKVNQIHKYSHQPKNELNSITPKAEPNYKPGPAPKQQPFINPVPESKVSPTPKPQEDLEIPQPRITPHPRITVPQPLPKTEPPSNSEVPKAPKYNKNLMTMVLKGQRNIVKEMLSFSEVEVNSQNEEGKTALMLAIEHGHTDMAKDLISYGADVSKIDSNGMTALLFAARDGHNELTKKLLLKGANVNQQDNKGMTALIYAACGGHDDVTRCLLSYNANIYLLDNNRLRALDYAIKAKHNNIVNLLRQKAK